MLLAYKLSHIDMYTIFKYNVASGMYDKILITIFYYCEYHYLSLKYKIYSSYTIHLCVYAKLYCVVYNEIQKNIFIKVVDRC